MDTDDLSEKTYRAILGEAERFHHDLTLQFGLLSYECKDETEYIQKSIQLIKGIKKISAHEMEDIFFETTPTKKDLLNVLNKILDNIKSLDEKLNSLKAKVNKQTQAKKKNKLQQLLYWQRH